MLLITIHIIVCVFLVGIVLLQQGKGADLGASLGGGGNTLFGAGGADNLLVRVTTGLALLFMTTSILLARSANESKIGEGTLFQNAPASSAPAANEITPSAPASDASPIPEASDKNVASENLASENKAEPQNAPAATEPTAAKPGAGEPASAASPG